jgi:antirestriction protein ArdC
MEVFDMKPELKKELYEQVTAGLIEQMEKGVAIWQRPWVISKAYQPQNGVSGRMYNGFNRMYLGYLQETMGTRDPRWFTFNNVKDLGAKVIKGSKSTIVVYNAPAKFDKENDEGEVETYTFWKVIYYRVYHATQVEGLPEYDAEVETPEQEDEGTCSSAISVLDSWCHDNLHSYEYGGNRACYIPTADTIQMPMPDMFKRESWYAQTLAHEIIHATGAEKRLNRLEKAGFGTDKYAKEELVAEFGSAMLCGSLGCEPDMEQSAAYLKGWANKCKEEPGLLISAANMAETATNFVLEDAYAVA